MVDPIPAGTPAPGAGQAALTAKDIANVAFLLSRGLAADKLPKDSAQLQAFADAYATMPPPAPPAPASPPQSTTTPPPLPASGASGSKPDVVLTDAQKKFVYLDKDGNVRAVVNDAPGLVFVPKQGD
jgi:hypothetical protein